VKKLCILSFLILGFLFLGGCTSPDVPDYTSLKNNIKHIDLKKSEIGNGKYTFVSNVVTDISLDEAGYHERYIDTIDGDISIKRDNNMVKLELLTKLPLFSANLLKVEVNTNKCGYISDTPLIEILNKNGTINYKFTNKLRNNKKIKKRLNQFFKSQSLCACANWKVGEVKEKRNSSFFSDSIGGDKLTFKILSLPVKYLGIVSYKGNSYYYFTIINGSAHIDSQMFNDNIAKFKIDGKILVNIKNLIAEYLNLMFKGNMWAEGYNFDVKFQNNYSLKWKN
jgi:hypothetical protein